MNIKRVLVLVLALVMAVSAFAPSMLAAFKPETHREHIEEKLNDPELIAQYEEVKATVEYIVKDIEENHEVYYADGYAYALENGYIDTAIEVIKVTLETLPHIDLDGVEMTEEFRVRLETELDALVPTLEKLLAILESGEASDFDGFVNAAITLEGDLYLHMNNIYAILEQGSIDLNQFILVPAFYEGLRLLEEEVIPAVEKAVEAFVEKVVDCVIEKFGPYYDKVVEIIDITRATYEKLVETVVKINLFVENVIEKYNALIEKILEIKGKVEDAIVIATNVFETVVEVVGVVKNAVVVTAQVFNYVVDLLIENRPAIESACEDIAEILEYAYDNKEEAYAVAAKLTAYITGIINDQLDDAVNGDYELTDDSYYVSFGNAAYAEALAGKLNLTKKHAVVTFGSNYANELAKADLVTVKLDNGSFVKLAEAQIEAKIAEIIKSNKDIMAWYANLDSMASNPFMPAAIKNAMAESKANIDSIVDFDAEVVELDWDKYLDAEGKAALDSLLATIKTKAMEQGISEYYYLDINPIINDILVENGLGGIFTLSFDPIVIPQVELITFAVENVMYGYVEFVGNATAVLENADEDATIVLTPVGNPLVGYSFKGIDLSEYADGAEAVVDLLNTHLYAVALTHDNVIFVNSEDAEDIYDALNVYCDHVHDSCTDKVCDRCLAAIEPLGHNFTDYVFTPSESCKEDGKEIAKCDRCDAVDVKVVPNTKGPHDWKEATCTSPEKCATCGIKRGEMLDHVLGDWRVVKDPTSNSEGMRERKCLHCEYKETETIPYDQLSTIAIVGIIIACVAVAGSLSALVAGILRRKNKI